MCEQAPSGTPLRIQTWLTTCHPSSPCLALVTTTDLSQIRREDLLALRACVAKERR
jgi:hypothetical protein